MNCVINVFNLVIHYYYHRCCKLLHYFCIKLLQCLYRYRFLQYCVYLHCIYLNSNYNGFRIEVEEISLLHIVHQALIAEGNVLKAFVEALNDVDDFDEKVTIFLTVVLYEVCLKRNGTGSINVLFYLTSKFYSISPSK